MDKITYNPVATPCTYNIGKPEYPSLHTKRVAVRRYQRFTCKLGRPVYRNWLKGSVTLRCRDNLSISIHCRSRGEHNLGNIMLAHGFEYPVRSHDIVLNCRIRIYCTLP